ncbi:hypothetical protein FHR83_007120 [Actinoplanes campanulatus]|uniref:Helix-turn-helix domain-containing protein n=1 Tax=Actinoplanes campanulatus TaxID=113559 RepID=A0A7W5FI87_9ACTN|nr:transcriptional regulator [Actinoplanes campanulatus]MBB3099414.1 hypothetical protein [Actinoplanes campanulatus]GGN40097.1 hypothetical protein GCM10010109_68720 [Actinoplanes campanulatus]GID42377.1 hypothetical protein Aca09nite_88830 [Actinoplanes campanulatus]
MPEATTPSNPLAQLIRQHMDATGDGYSSIGRKAGLGRATVQALATRELKAMPAPDTLRRLATGLGLTTPEGYQTVLRAAEAATGYYVYGGAMPDTDSAYLMASVQELTPEQRAQIAALVQSMRKTS